MSRDASSFLDEQVFWKSLTLLLSPDPIPFIRKIAGPVSDADLLRATLPSSERVKRMKLSRRSPPILAILHLRASDKKMNARGEALYRDTVGLGINLRMKVRKNEACV